MPYNNYLQTSAFQNCLEGLLKFRLLCPHPKRSGVGLTLLAQCPHLRNHCYRRKSSVLPTFPFNSLPQPHFLFIFSCSGFLSSANLLVNSLCTFIHKWSLQLKLLILSRHLFCNGAYCMLTFVLDTAGIDHSSSTFPSASLCTPMWMGTSGLCNWRWWMWVKFIVGWFLKGKWISHEEWYFPFASAGSLDWIWPPTHQSLLRRRLRDRFNDIFLKF